MGFKSIVEVAPTGSSFNSAVSANFKDLYDNIVLTKYKKEMERESSRTFAPSSFRCDRLSYFRLRGVDPDIADPDPQLEFTAILGTACHKEIQKNLKDNLGSQWVSVRDYLKLNPIDYEYVINEEEEFETKIEFLDPPIKFACDGIIKVGEEYYLLEIKTSEYNSFKKLNEPKQHHIDQIKCYCALLGIHKALVLYQERQWGEIKCYELVIPQYQIDAIFDKMRNVLEHVENNIAPERLPSGDFWCKYCKYKKRCKQWG